MTSSTAQTTIEMQLIWKETWKFYNLGPALDNDNTSRIEAQLQRRFLQLTEEKTSLRSVQIAIRATGLQCLNMYGHCYSESSLPFYMSKAITKFSALKAKGLQN